MDYNGLAEEFLESMRAIGMAKRQRCIQEGVQGEASVLYLIKENEEVIPSIISESLNISSARVAAALNSLDSKGLITREISGSDRRKIIVKLTPEGKEHAEKQRRDNIEQVKGILMMLGENDAKEYIRILGKMAELLSAVRT